MARISVIDSWGFKFSQRMIDWWTEKGHTVTKSVHWGPHLVEGFDVAYFPETDNNLIQASRKQIKPDKTFVLAEAVDIDIYSNHPGAVSWEYASALIFMAEHMREYAEERFNFPESLPRYVVPGGIDLNQWTLVDRPIGYNVAWIGRLWVAKGFFDALQIFNQLIKTDPNGPWRLYCLGKGWSPPHWWKRHCEAYLKLNTELSARMTLTEQVPDVNTWLEDKDFLIQTSLKEAFSYVVCESAAKGIRPVIQQTLGATDIWPREWVFDTHDEAVGMLLGDYDRARVRAVAAERYPLERRMKALESITGLDFMV